MSFVQPPYWANERGGARRWPQDVRLSCVTPPTEEPVTLAEAKLHVKVDGPESDTELATWILAARQDVEHYTQHACVTQAWDLTLSYFPVDRRAIAIPLRPLQSVSGIDYVDASGQPQTLDPSLYVVDAPQGEYPPAGRVMLQYGTYYWPFPPGMSVANGVTIHFVAGYGDATTVPATLKAAMLLLIGNWWRNREAGAIIRGSSDLLPFGVDRLLEPFRPETLA
jgi:uncharacterized phiE125 gp8 family phage protein